MRAALKARREDLGLTQEQVARAARVSLRTYAAVERGARPAYKTMLGIAKALEWDLAHLMSALPPPKRAS